MRETWVWSLSLENPLEKDMATCSSILSWKILLAQEPGGLQFMGLQRVGHNWVTNIFTLKNKKEMKFTLFLKFKDSWQKILISGIQHNDPTYIHYKSILVIIVTKQIAMSFAILTERNCSPWLIYVHSIPFKLRMQSSIANIISKITPLFCCCCFKKECTYTLTHTCTQFPFLLKQYTFMNTQVDRER